MTAAAISYAQISFPSRRFDPTPIPHLPSSRLHHPRPLQTSTYDPSTLPPPRPKNRAKTQTFLWNLEIRRCVDDGCQQEAIDLYRKMRSLGVRSDNFTYPFVIKACYCVLEFDELPKIHGRLVKIGLDSDIYICNALVAGYSKMGRVDSAREVFDEMPARDIVSWNSMMSGFVEVGEGLEALWYLRMMQRSCGLGVDRCTIVAGLASCSLEGCLKEGKQMHCHALRRGLESDDMVRVAIVDMYCKSRDVVSAERFFEKMDRRSVVAWNALIAGYSINDRSQDVLVSFKKMLQEGIAPDSVTTVNLLTSLAELRDIREGQAVHGVSIKKCFVPNTILETALINMYAKCRNLACAEILFAKMVYRSLVSWNAMITAYVQNERYIEALEVFLGLQNGFLKPDRFTISGVLSASAELMLLQNGKQLHGYAMKLGFGMDTLILNSILYMYAKCGYLQSSTNVFQRMMNKDVISWNSIIMAHAIHGEGKTALGLFSEMREKNYLPNESTFVSVLTACSISGLVDEGWRYFYSMQQEYNMEPQIEHYGCIVDLLGRVGDLGGAESFTRQMPLVPTARIWGSLLTASRNQNDIKYAEVAAENIFSLDHNNIGCYIVLLNMYADAGRWDDVERMRCRLRKEEMQKVQIRSVVELNNKTCSFVNADRSFAWPNIVYDIANFFSRKTRIAGKDYGLTFRLQEAILKEASSPIRHSVRLAVCYCIMSTKIGTPVLVKKNARICISCHNAIKVVSKFSRREIIVGDSRIFHHFNNGICSCGDYW